jgi:hypothetical protein
MSDYEFIGPLLDLGVARTTLKTVSSIVSCWTFFTEPLPGVDQIRYSIINGNTGDGPVLVVLFNEHDLVSSKLCRWSFQVKFPSINLIIINQNRMKYLKTFLGVVIYLLRSPSNFIHPVISLWSCHWSLFWAKLICPHTPPSILFTPRSFEWSLSCIKCTTGLKILIIIRLLCCK